MTISRGVVKADPALVDELRQQARTVVVTPPTIGITSSMQKAANLG